MEVVHKRLINPYEDSEFATELPPRAKYGLSRKRVDIAFSYLNDSLVDAAKDYNFCVATSEDVSISENIMALLKDRYFAVDGNGNAEKRWGDLCRRVARSIAASFAWTHYYDIGTDEQAHLFTTKESLYDFVKVIEKAIFVDMSYRRFLFNSPALFSAGTPVLVKELPPETTLINKRLNATNSRSLLLYSDVFPSLEEYVDIGNICQTGKNHQLMACFILGVQDDLDDIFESVRRAGKISKTGGGVGINFSNLRESGSVINGGFGGFASGPISFMRLWDTMGAVIVQGGKRRAALMGMLDDDHPDIEQFINCKTEEGVLPYFNISVALSDAFLHAVATNKAWSLSSRSGDGGTVLDARKLWYKIGAAAWGRGDPGVFFKDSANWDNLLFSEPAYKINCTNPCGEIPSSDNSSCNLGSIDVAKFNGLASPLDSLWHQAVRGSFYLDLILDATDYPITEIKENTREIRPLGLGIMGLADYFIKQRVVYGSGESVVKLEELMDVISSAALFTTLITAEIFGPAQVADVMAATFDNAVKNNSQFDKTSKEECCLRSLFTSLDALTGRCFPFPMTIHGPGADSHCMDRAIETFIMENINAGRMRNSRRLSIAPTGSLSMIAETSSGLEPNFGWRWLRKITSTDGSGVKEMMFFHKLLSADQQQCILEGGNLISEAPYMVTVADLDIEAHLAILFALAPYVDQGISKTVNAPEDSTIEDVLDVYRRCYEAGVKGVTIYRDNSRSGQPIQTIKAEGKPVSENSQRGVVKKRVTAIRGYTTKTFTPWGSLYVTLNALDNEPFETFLSIGKAGSELKAVTEALSRVISISLRSGTKLGNITSTIKDIGGSETWAADFSDSESLRSLPDAIGKALEYLNFVHCKESRATTSDGNVEITEAESAVLDGEVVPKGGLKCVECGAPMVRSGGCPICLTCAFSKCK